MNYWLMKSEPDVFSLEDLRRRGKAPWDGVRNFQARNNLRAMRSGDQAFFYHSSTTPTAIVGLMEIVRPVFPDPTQFDPKHPGFDARSSTEKPLWDQVEVRYLGTLPRALSLEEIKKTPALGSMILLQNTRLSVQPVTSDQWRAVRALAGEKV